MALHWAWVMAGWAAEPPEVSATESGAMRGSVEVSADVDAVRALIRDPVALARIVDGEVQVSTQDDGDCKRVTTTAPHPLMSVTYTTRSCPTETGVQDALVESSQLSTFQAEWKVEPLGAGSRITYQLDVRPKVPVPSFMVRRSARKGVVDSLVAVRDRFSGG